MGFTDIEVDSGGDYIELIGGTVVSFHILSASPQKDVIHWKDRKKSSCIGKGCELCAEGNKAKQRWTIEVFDRKDQKVKKLEFGAMIATQLKAIAEMLAENHQTVRDIDIRIKTTGSGLETEYNVINTPMGGEISREISEKYPDLPF